MTQPASIAIVPMELHHMAEVCSIEQASFTDPWSDDAWRAELAYQDSSCYVALDESGAVAGALALRRIVDDVHVMKLAVRDDMRRRGIAFAMVSTGLKDMQKKGCRRAWLELRGSNHAAAAFYRKLGFSPAGLRKGYYRNPAEDAVLMSRPL
jgi:ribosomal-protein-alanine N-acetyltransferase